ncbi:MAG: hypothetical protein H6981_07085 [Gammaproteobacteria bacterium]|nr:hypothetical protein [Gammaproteobacteria bacterium]
MITETVYDLGALRRALAHLPDDCPIHNEEGLGLKLHYDNDLVVLFDSGDYPDTDDESEADVICQMLKVAADE